MAHIFRNNIKWLVKTDMFFTSRNRYEVRMNGVVLNLIFKNSFAFGYNNKEQALLSNYNVLKLKNLNIFANNLLYK